VASALKLPGGGAFSGQPIVPWLGVISATAMQIAVTHRAARRKHIPLQGWLICAGLSLYDAVTTFAGLSTNPWVIERGLWIQIPATIIITFGFELAVGLIVKKETL
jgi:hypothetical protein